MKSCSGLFIGLLLSVSIGAEPLLEGQVRLSSGQPAVGVQVRLFDLTNLHQSVGTTTDETGHFTLSLPAAATRSALPQGFALGQNYPNPFNPSTIIPYQIPTAAHVRLAVFNLLGQRIATLVDAERAAGMHTAQWDATDAAGRAVGTGVYIYQLSSDGMKVSRRMVLIDGQAGIPAAGAAGPMQASALERVEADAEVYGLTVSGEGLVAYVNPAFRVGVDEVEIVVDEHSSTARMKRAAGGILGDVDNNERVDFFDALLVALYSGDASIVLPNNGDISLGDVNGDSRVDLTDAWLIAAYLNDPSDPTLPSGIGKPVGPVSFAPLDEQTFNSQMVGKSLHAETFFFDFLSAGRFSESGRIPGSYSYSNTGPNTGTVTLSYNDDRCILKLTFASATTGTLSFTCDSGIEGKSTWRISGIGTPIAPIVVPRSGTDTGLEAVFVAFFEAEQTRAYDFQIRLKTPQGEWLNTCNEFTNPTSNARPVRALQGFIGLESGTVYEVRYRYRNSSRCGEGTPGPWSEIGEGATSGGGTSLLRFPEGKSATRSIPENIPAGINVGDPVSAIRGDTLSTLTYTISGPDALSFDIVPETGQIRTREGVTYDYESKKYYSVAVGVEDGAGNSDTIDVTIHILNLVPSCELPSNLNLRTSHSDERLTLRWDALPEMQGQARVLGYQTEIRRGRSGAWTDRRTFFGRNITAIIYANLDNESGYQVRVRPINAEGDCGWSRPVWGIPTADFAPKDPADNFDRFGYQPVGSPEQNLRFLTPGRCRHTSNGQTLDADCQYEKTGPHTSRIVLEFDDPSLGSCEVVFAYSSLTAGSFIDECSSSRVRGKPVATRDDGGNTNVPFDHSFRMPSSVPQTEDESDVPRAPRTEEEFQALVFGRDDLIPGLTFGCPPPLNCIAKARVAFVRGWSEESNLPHLKISRYTYKNTGPYQGELTFQWGDEPQVFKLDFEPVGNVRATITNPDGHATFWPGMPHLDLTLGAQPILLPIPPSWSAAIAVETDFGPAAGNGSGDVQTAILNKFFPGLSSNLLPSEGGLNFSQDYIRLGRNRAIYTVEFPQPNGSKWSFDLSFIADGAAKYTLTITREGYLPTVEEGFIDFAGDSINPDEFPDELLPPDDPPQESGEDLSGVEVAAAVTSSSIGGDDVQTFFVNNGGAAYSPGDWLEPKDGGNQRMMVVGGGSAGKPVASSGVASPRPHPRILKSTISSHASSIFPSAMMPRAKRASQPAHLTASSTMTQLSVVCMQKDHDIPTRGDRYFSQPKTAQDAVQLCQQNCVLNETDNIQQCVWECEADAQ